MKLKLDHFGADLIKTRLPGIRELSMNFADVDPIIDTYSCCSNLSLYDGWNSHQCPWSSHYAEYQGKIKWLKVYMPW